ncbi:hypothetical protein L9F63_025680, partial [Diploptera punctata]
MGKTDGFVIVRVKPELVDKSPTVGQREVELNWKLDCALIDGNVVEYHVNLTGISNWVKGFEKPLTVETPFARFINLQPFSTYTVHIAVIGEDGSSDEEYSLVQEFTTAPAKPGKVGHAVAYSFGENWIDLRWEEPYPPTGKLQHYEVRYRSGVTEMLSQTVKTDDYCVLWKKMICTRIGNLKEYVDYEVKISSKNADVYKFGEPEILRVTTKEGVPDPPTDITVLSSYPQGVKLKWSHPNITRGTLLRFEANILLKSTALRRSRMYNKTKKLTVHAVQPDYTLEVNDLYPASEYEMSIYGVTVAEGESSQLKWISSLSDPDIGSHLSVEPDSLTDTTFEITLPQPDEFLTKWSAYILIVSSEDETADYKFAMNFCKQEVKSNILKEAGITDDRKSWIAAEIKPGEREVFTIGDNKTQETDMVFVCFARNRPLTPGGAYQVALVAVNMWNEHYTYSAVKLENTIRTLSEYKPDEGSSVAGWVVAVLLLLCIPPVVFWFIKRRRATNKRKMNVVELKPNDSIIVADAPSVLEPETSVSKLPPSQRFSRRVAIADLEEYVKTGLISGELQRQHELFPRGQTRPWDYGKLPQNKTKNRYGNLVA